MACRLSHHWDGSTPHAEQNDTLPWDLGGKRQKAFDMGCTALPMRRREPVPCECPALSMKPKMHGSSVIQLGGCNHSWLAQATHQHNVIYKNVRIEAMASWGSITKGAFTPAWLGGLSGKEKQWLVQWSNKSKLPWQRERCNSFDKIEAMTQCKLSMWGW